MTRKHYIALADSIGLELRHEPDQYLRAGMWKIARTICGPLKQDNRSFDKEKFIDHITDVAYHGKEITT